MPALSLSNVPEAYCSAHNCHNRLSLQMSSLKRGVFAAGAKGMGFNDPFPVRIDHGDVGIGPVSQGSFRDMDNPGGI